MADLAIAQSDTILTLLKDMEERGLKSGYAHTDFSLVDTHEVVSITASCVNVHMGVTLSFRLDGQMMDINEFWLRVT